MPIYEYECDQCGHHVEALQKFSDPPITECERCHGRMKKLISQNTFRLKGTGWYVTDYASKSEAQAGSGAQNSTGGTEGSKKKEAGGEKKDSGGDSGKQVSSGE